MHQRAKLANEKRTPDTFSPITTEERKAKEIKKSFWQL